MPDHFDRLVVQPRSTAARTVWVTSPGTKAPVVVNVTNSSTAPPGDAGFSFSQKLVFNGDPTANDAFVGNGDGATVGAPNPDSANDNFGNVVLSNAVLTNNVLTNNSLTNKSSQQRADQRRLSNVVLSNAVLPT